MAIQATGRATFTAVEDYDIVFVLNGVRCDTLNFDSVRSLKSAVLEADFTNGGAPCVVDRAVLAYYDDEGALIGSTIEVHDSSSAVAEGGNLYLSKDCMSISCEIYQGEKRLCARSITVVRNGSGVSVKAVAYKVLNNVDAGAALNWDSVPSQTNYPTQKPDKGKYCYVMTIVLYTDGTTTNSVSTSYTPMDGNNGTSVTIKDTKVEYAGGDSGTTVPASGWNTSVPQLDQGKFLWTRTTVVFSDGKSTVSYSVGRIGMDGSKGGTTHILYASSASPKSVNDIRDTIDANHQYYGTYQDTALDDDVNKYEKVKSWVLIRGDAGTQYSTLEKYAYGTSNTHAPESGWSDSISGGTAGQYLWNQETAQHKSATDSDWVKDSVTTHCIGYIAKDGANGANFTGILERYKATDDSINAPAADRTWKDTPTAAGWSKDKPCLWNYEIVERDKGASIITTPHLDSVWGSKGDDSVSYRLVRMSDTSATVLASDSTTSATFHLHYNLHYKAVKMVGTVSGNVNIATIKATIEGAEKVTTVNGLEGTLSGDGTKSYDASNRPANAIPVTVTLADGTVLYDTIPVTMEAGVAVDINKNLGQIKQTVADHTGKISTITHKADEISMKVGSMATGKNMWINGAFDMAEDIRPFIWPNDCNYSLGIDGDDYPLGFDHRVQFTVSNVGSGIYFKIGDYVNGQKAQSALKLQKGQGYCLSFWARTAGITSLKAWIGIENIYMQYPVITDKWARYSIYFDNTLDITNAQTVLFYTAQPASGLLLLTGIQFEQGTKEKGAPSVWSRSQAEFGETGIDITTGKITVMANNFVVKSNSGVETAAVDAQGNLTAGSLTCKDNVSGTVMSVMNGFFSALKGKAGIRLGLDGDGYPCLMGVDPDGNVLWSLGQKYKKQDLNTEVTFSVKSIEAYAKMNSSAIGEGVVLTLTVKNGTNTAITINSSNISGIASSDSGRYKLLVSGSTDIAVGDSADITLTGTHVTKIASGTVFYHSPIGQTVLVEVTYQGDLRLSDSASYTSGGVLSQSSSGVWSYSIPKRVQSS